MMQASSSNAGRLTLLRSFLGDRELPRMIRPFRSLLAIAFLAAGVAVGALNPGTVTVDLGVLRFDATLGVVMLVALLLGVLLGGLVLTASVILPMRHRWHRERRVSAAALSESSLRSSLDASRLDVSRVTGEAGHGIHQ